MAAGDHAILVGISKYVDPGFGPLQGPPNDVALFRDWLLSPDGGDVPAAQVTVITSPAAFDPDLDPDRAPPLAEEFKLVFRKLIRDDRGRPLARPGRLYLYFSGHGFCEKKSQTPEGALYAANATSLFPENIYGTHYAQVVRDKALFGEVVLVMDCCRDAEVNRAGDVPAINEAGATAASAVKLFCLYAAPKGGKAQERPIAERGGKVCGLLTHAFLKAIEQARPDAPPLIGAAALKAHLLETWAAVCGDQPAPLPEVVLPTGDELYFRSGNRGMVQEFRFAQPPAGEVTLAIVDGRKRPVSTCVLRPPPQPSLVDWGGGRSEALAFDGSRFVLPLPAGFYRYTATGALATSSLFAVEGVGHVEL